MVAMRSLNQFLQNRNGHWHYVRRDAVVEADDLYWATLIEQTGATGKPVSTPALTRYRAAKKRALARGFVYTPATELVDTAGLGEILDRLVEVARRPQTEKGEEEALLGGVEPAAVKVSEAFEIYCTQIAVSELFSKSDEQKASWKKVKKRAVSNFTALCGDLPMDKISRKHAQEFYNWWALRLKKKEGKKALNPNSANRDLGNMRSLYRAYWEFEGEEKRENPFAKLRFGNVVYKEIPPFDDDWVRTKILIPGLFDGLNEEAKLIIYALIETGCRPSEIANLEPENIILDHDVPHLKMRDRDGRKLKSRSSARDVPLVGISLEAMKRAPQGFPRYKDKGALLSASLLKAFKARKLFPTENHRIYSFRHSLEKRMLEADLDYGLRCILMGHHDTRPQYGDGGSLEFRRDQLLKNVHPYPEGLFAA